MLDVNAEGVVDFACKTEGTQVGGVRRGFERLVRVDVDVAGGGSGVIRIEEETIGADTSGSEGNRAKKQLPPAIGLEQELSGPKSEERWIWKPEQKLCGSACWTLWGMERSLLVSKGG